MEKIAKKPLDKLSKKPLEKITEKSFDKFSEDDKIKDKKGRVYQDPKEISKQDYIRMGVLSTVSFYLHTVKLGYPNFVTSIELETTRQVNWYMAGKFFIGKFPPLSSILFSGLARLAGYFGAEDLLYEGQAFGNFPLAALRRFSAIIGAFLVPLAYMTLRNMGHSRSTATLASALVLFENGIITQSRFASPEIFVVFFCALATYSWSLVTKYSKSSQNSFKLAPELWQVLTGISMGLAISSKWTGLLMYPIIWSIVLLDAWNKLCEKSNQINTIAKRLSINLLTIGLLPLAVYTSIFVLHFNLVPSSGDHDLLISSELKYSLNGNLFEPTQPNIAYGSQVTIKHTGTTGGYLHSHSKRFTGGSAQQEVTLYPFANDLNNVWIVHKNAVLWNSSHPLEFIRNGDQIRFEHLPSTRKLHSHDHRPQLTAKPEHSEVTAYGDRLVDDSHDFWVLQILNDDGTPNEDKLVTWQPLTQKFRLQHIRGCFLMSRNSYYAEPEGENHQEVTCMQSPITRLSSWVVESAKHDHLTRIRYMDIDKPSLIQKLKEVHTIMANYPEVIYNRFDVNIFESGPLSHLAYLQDNPRNWLLKKSTKKIWSQLTGFSSHLVINPIIQKATVASVISFIGFWALDAFFSQRQMKLPQWLSSFKNSLNIESISIYYSSVVIQILLLDILPKHTLTMSDIISVMYYGAGLFSVLLESSISYLRPNVRNGLVYGLLIASFLQFSQLSFLAYGGEKWSRSQCEQSGLNIDCTKFPPSHHDLAKIIQESGNTVNSTMLTISIELPNFKTQPFRYDQGREEEAERMISEIKQNAFQKEAKVATGAIRYNRVIPTPALTPAEAEAWGQEVHQAALMRTPQDVLPGNNTPDVPAALQAVHKFMQENSHLKVNNGQIEPGQELKGDPNMYGYIMEQIKEGKIVLSDGLLDPYAVKHQIVQQEPVGLPAGVPINKNNVNIPMLIKHIEMANKGGANLDINHILEHINNGGDVIIDPNQLPMDAHAQAQQQAQYHQQQAQYQQQNQQQFEPAQVEPAQVEPAQVEPAQVEPAQQPVESVQQEAKQPAEPVMVEEVKAQEPPQLVQAEEVKVQEPAEPVQVEEVKAQEPTEPVQAEEVKAQEPAQPVQVEEVKVQEPAQPVQVEEVKVQEPAQPVQAEEVKVQEPAQLVQVEEVKVQEPAQPIQVEN